MIAGDVPHTPAKRGGIGLSLRCNQSVFDKPANKRIGLAVSLHGYRDNTDRAATSVQNAFPNEIFADQLMARGLLVT